MNIRKFTFNSKNLLLSGLVIFLLDLLTTDFYISKSCMDSKSIYEHFIPLQFSPRQTHPRTAGTSCSSQSSPYIPSLPQRG